MLKGPVLCILFQTSDVCGAVNKFDQMRGALERLLIVAKFYNPRLSTQSSNRYVRKWRVRVISTISLCHKHPFSESVLRLLALRYGHRCWI